MFTPQGPSLRELTVQALSSIEHGYDLLAPKFDATPFRTDERILSATTRALRPYGPFAAGLDLCCGTGAGMGVLRQLCARSVTGVDFSAGMLATARPALPSHGRPAVHRVRGDARRLPFAEGFDLVVSFGAFGHFLPHERPGLFAEAHRVLRPGGLFAFPVGAPPRVGSRRYWMLWGFDAAMRVRNAVWRPTFVMYYRTFPLEEVRKELTRTGFAVSTVPLPEFGTGPEGEPRGRLVVARRE